MASATLQRPMTTEELLAIPEDGIDRYLIRGELREKPMTRHNSTHSRIEVIISYYLETWRRTRPEPRGAAHGGEAGVILQRDPDTTVGIDVVYISADLAAKRKTTRSKMIEGIPTLAVEILSPSDTQEEIEEKIEQYQLARVPLIWIVSPQLQTVTVLRLGKPPEAFNITQELLGDPELPGLHIPVADIFGS